MRIGDIFADFDDENSAWENVSEDDIIVKKTFLKQDEEMSELKKSNKSSITVEDDIARGNVVNQVRKMKFSHWQQV